MEIAIEQRRERREVISLVICGVTFVSMIGCAQTVAPVKVSHTYRERIENIVFSPSFQKVIVLGERFHYIFDDQGALSRILGSGFTKDLMGTFEPFVVDSSNHISGSYTIELTRALSSTESHEAEALGFRKADSGRYQLRAKVDGLRYTTTPLATLPAPLAINRKYTVEVNVMASGSTSPHTSALTGFADGVALILLSPLIVLLLFTDPCITCR